MEHIAILRQPFFDMVLNGEKTIESRWSQNKIAPYNRIKKGDIIWLKETGKCVTAKAVADKVMFFNLTKKLAEEIRLNYEKEIGIDKFDNWNDVSNKKYCTLIWLKDVKRVSDIKVKRSNGSGWITVDKLNINL